ncbi:hypothetical protein BGX23_003671 [Mortierella sp. AD031]|nr:hypothetical protein BGX23_003671 [Mortierella sp. AD031]
MFEPTTPATPFPSSTLFSNYRDTPLQPSPGSSPPTSSAYDSQDDDNIRDYFEEERMVQLLERRRALSVQPKHASKIRISFTPTDTDADAAATTSSRRHRDRSPRPDSNRSSRYDNQADSWTLRLWSWLLQHCRKSVGTGTSHGRATRHHHDHHHYSRINNRSIMIKWANVSLLPVMIGLGLILLHALRPPTDLRFPEHPRSAFYNQESRNESLLSMMDREGGREGSEGEWRTSLRNRWSLLRSLITKTPTGPSQPEAKHTLPSLTLTHTTEPNGSTQGTTSSSNNSYAADMWTALHGLVQRIYGVERSLDHVDADVALIQQQLRSDRWIEDKVLEPIREEIPAQVILARDPNTGKIQFPVDFWDGVKDFFVSRGYLASAVKGELGQQRAEENESRKGGWIHFLTMNEARIKNKSHNNNELNPRSVSLSRQEFLDLVAAESNAIWANLESKITYTIHQQLDQWEADASGPAGGQGILSRIEQHILIGMINLAVERQCRLSNGAAQPDYALYNSGGRIVTQLTTPDYHQYTPSTFFGRMLGLRYLIPPPSSPERLAVKAIQTGMEPGDCWSMLGSQGQIAIRLARRIVITGVTIEHVDPKVSLDLGSAPREIEIWRLVAPLTPPSSSSLSSSSIMDGDSPIMATWHKYGSPQPGASLLTTVMYEGQGRTDGCCSDADGGAVIAAAQTFSIPMSRQNAPAYGILVRILSNWGHPNFTCLYRVRVHGYEA